MFKKKIIMIAYTKCNTIITSQFTLFIQDGRLLYKALAYSKREKQITQIYIEFLHYHQYKL